MQGPFPCQGFQSLKKMTSQSKLIPLRHSSHQTSPQLTTKKTDSKANPTIWRISRLGRFGNRSLRSSGLIVRTKNSPTNVETRKKEQWLKNGAMLEVVLRRILPGKRSILMWPRILRRRGDGSGRTGRPKTISQDKRPEMSFCSCRSQMRMKSFIKKVSQSRHCILKHRLRQWKSTKESDHLTPPKSINHWIQCLKCRRVNLAVSICSVILRRMRIIMGIGCRRRCKPNN